MSGAIVVTGACRTGTSLMMQTLRLLGVPVKGLEYHEEFPNDDFHPHGAWDLPFEETLNGIHGHECDGNAVKLFGIQLSRSTPESIERAIVCRRNRTDAIASAERARVARGQDNLDFADVYDKNYVCIGCYTELWGIPILDVQFELMLKKPRVQVPRIAAFVDLQLTHALLDLACENVLGR